jgi:hypothetical protein
MPDLTFEEWHRTGYENGWCGPALCYTHDGVPTSTAEDEAWENGDDPCIHVVRLYEDNDMKTAVEQNHSPSQWRASNAGLV